MGSLLLFIPHIGIELCGLPEANTYSYGSILGAVLLGIGIALLVERHFDRRLRGLGFTGASAINFVAAGAVAIWLLVDPFAMPLSGYVIL